MVEVHVEPSPLPALKKGDHCRVRIRLKGGWPGEPAHIRILGATNTHGEDRIRTVGHQALTYEPSIDLTIQATQDGTPSIIVSSPRKRFEPVTVNGHTTPILLGPSKDWIMLPPTTPPPAEEALLEEFQMSDPQKPTPSRPATANPIHPPQIVEEKRGWWLGIAGAVFFFITFGALAWWFNRDPSTRVDAALVTSAEDSATPTQEAEPAPVAEEPAPQTVAEAEATPPAAEPPAAPAEPEPLTAAPAAAPTANEPTNCKFVNGNRPQKDAKYILTCDQGEYLAKGEYDFEVQNFQWKDFEEYEPTK